MDSTKTEGIVRVQYKKGAEVIKYLTAVEYDEFAFVRICHGEKGSEKGIIFIF